MMKHIVFIPGVMGSELIEGRRCFGGITRWFSLRKTSVERLNLNYDNNIIAGGPLEYGLRMLGNTVRVKKIYAPIIESLSSLDAATFTFHSFGYDWRKNIWETCAELHALLTRLNGEEIQVVAHSMGALLIHSYCQWCDLEQLPKITKVITIGAPWKGAPDAFKVLKYGIRDQGNFLPSPNLMREIGKTFPTSYQLLPSQAYCQENPYIMNAGKYLNWNQSMAFIENMVEYSMESIDQINVYLYDSLQMPWPSLIEHYNIIGVDHGTVGVISIGEDGTGSMKLPVDGDGTVPLVSALPYTSVNCMQTVYVKASHQGLVLDKNVLQFTNNILVNNDATLIGDLREAHIARTDWVMKKIDCPVDVLLLGEEALIDHPFEKVTRHEIENATYLIYNQEVPCKIEVEAYDDGRTSIETIQIIDNQVQSIMKFPSIKADPEKKAYIDLSFKDAEPITKVFYMGEAEKEKVVIAGIQVEVPRYPLFDPPKTTIVFPNKEQRQGVHIVFDVINNGVSHYLETLYSVNGMPYERFEDEIELTAADGLLDGRNEIAYFSKDVYDNIEPVQHHYFDVQ